jgi:hypothetical protein
VDHEGRAGGVKRRGHRCLVEWWFTTDGGEVHRGVASSGGDLLQVVMKSSDTSPIEGSMGWRGIGSCAASIAGEGRR